MAARPGTILFGGLGSSHFFLLSHTVRLATVEGTRRKTHMGEAFLDIHFSLCIPSAAALPAYERASERAGISFLRTGRHIHTILSILR